MLLFLRLFKEIIHTLLLTNFLLKEKIDLCVSEELIAEYYEVLYRPKFSKFPDFFARAETILAEIQIRARKFTPTIKLDIIEDVDDNVIIELADECLADFIITGNSNDFTFPFYKHTQIVSPRVYWENHRPI